MMNRLGIGLTKRSFGFISAESVAYKLKHKPEQLLVLDVREPEMYGKGHLKRSINIESKRILASESIDSLHLIQEGGNVPPPLLVVHCQLSLIRGPSCAAHLEKLIKAKPEWKQVQIKVMEGGYKGWSSNSMG
jgi:rhodanese-related sulfurtransferase